MIFLKTRVVAVTATLAVGASLVAECGIGAASELESNNHMRGSSVTAGDRYRNVVRRLYGPDSVKIRKTIEELESATPYKQTGIPSNPEHVVPYRNHPYASYFEDESSKGSNSQERRRKMQKEDDDEGADLFRPLRIRFETAALDQTRNVLNGHKVDFVKREILTRMAEFWTKALSVVPVDGNLKINTGELSGKTYCGDSEFSAVPFEHSTTGLPETDLVLYISGRPSTRFCGPSTLAVAVACNFDQFDRPTAGAINFCLEQIEVDADGTASEAVIQDNVDVAIHEAAHVLGMSSNSYRFFWDSSTRRPRTSRGFRASTVECVDGVVRTVTLPDENTMKFFVTDEGQRHATIVTPKVAAVARNQFDCQSLEGAQLENQPTGASSCTGDHWDERLFYPEALSGVISPTTNILSPLTLALMEDSGWYRANYSMSYVSPWGHGAGCDFVSKKCLQPSQDGSGVVIPDYGRGYFCSSSDSRGCSPAHTHKMACTLMDYSVQFYPPELPDEHFQYFPNDPALGGPRQADFCPLYGSTYGGMTADNLDCRVSGNDPVVNLYSETYGPDSMCFETNTGEARCYQAKCIVDQFVLKVFVRERWHTCRRDFQRIDIEVSGGITAGKFTCPRLSTVCPDMFCPVNCAGRGVCNFNAQQEVNGTIITRPRCECFDKNDTSPGCSESLKLGGRYLEDASTLVDLINEDVIDALVAVFVDHPDDWSRASWIWAGVLLFLLSLMILCICSSLLPCLCCCLLNKDRDSHTKYSPPPSQSSNVTTYRTVHRHPERKTHKAIVVGTPGAQSSPTTSNTSSASGSRKHYSQQRSHPPHGRGGKRQHRPNSPPPRRHEV